MFSVRRDAVLSAVPALSTGSVRVGVSVLPVPHLSGADVVLIVLALFAAGVVFAVAHSRMNAEGDGLATGRHIREAMSLGAARASAAFTRPSMTPDERKRAPGSAVGISLGRTQQGLRRQLWATLEDIVLLVGPPRMGKSTHLRKVIIDAPGAVVTTSTKTDIHEWTEAERRLGGSRTYVFNPERLGNVDNSFRWSPVAGCQIPQIAIDRAGYFLAGASSAGTNDREFWDGNNFRVLRCLLHAAALGDKTIADVAAWCGPGAERKRALDILDRHVTDETRDWAEDLRHVLNMPERTRESIFAALALTFEFLKNPAVRSAVVLMPGQRSFNVRRFIEQRGTLYLLGAEKPRGSLAPLFTAFTGHLFETAKHMASRSPGGRLDPPLMLALDEAALICPVPLERWTADASGRGIPMVIAVQSPSQLYDRWGERAGETIFTNCTVKMVLGGLSVAKHLADLEALCGLKTIMRPSDSTDSNGRRSNTKTPERVPAMPAAQIRMLRKLEVLVLHRNTPALLAKIAPLPRRPKRELVNRTVRPRPAPPRPAKPGAERRDEKLAPIVPMAELRKAHKAPEIERRTGTDGVGEASPHG